MDPVDILTVAMHAAQLIRSGNDLEEAFAGAYKTLELKPPDDGNDPLAVRIARLADAAGAKRDKLIEFLFKQSGPLPLNRLKNGWGEAGLTTVVENEEIDAEAEKLMNYAAAEEAVALEMMGSFPAFSVAQKRVSGYFGKRVIIIRDGKRLTEEQAGESRAGDSMNIEAEGLPTTVRGLIDYPLDKPCLFTINVGEEPWSVWDICCAFAEQYVRIYEQPEKYAIWGHDLTDLWIERLFYFPEKRLIYPHVGS
jgi:hypothetical protein